MILIHRKGALASLSLWARILTYCRCTLRREPSLRLAITPFSTVSVID